MGYLYKNERVYPVGMNFYGIIQLFKDHEKIDLSYLMLIYHDVRYETFGKWFMLERRMRNWSLSEVLLKHSTAQGDMAMLENWFEAFYSDKLIVFHFE